MSSQTRSQPRRGGPGRQSKGHGRGRGGRGRGTPNRPTSHQPPARFKGNKEKLTGHIFDCSDYRQADTFVNTHKRTADFVGAEN
jgi:hypothetical protein